MNEIYFLIRYIPFWAIPILLLATEFAYIFWLRKKKKLVFMCVNMATFCFVSIVYYFIMGGPERSVKAAMEFVWYYTR